MLDRGRWLRRAGFPVAFAILAGVALLSLIRVRRFRSDVDWRAHTRVVLQHIDAAQTAFLAADSYRRSYRLSREPSDLDNLELRCGVGQNELAIVRDLTRDNAIQQARLRDLRPLIEERLSILRTGLELPTFDQLDPIVREIQRGIQRRGSALAKSSDAIFDAMRRTEFELLDVREKQATLSALDVENDILYGSVPGLFLTVFFYASLSLENRERAIAQASLRDANRQLVDQAEELRVLSEALAMQASRDPLTDLFNRRYIAELLTRELSRVLRKGGSLVVMMVDVDHFKTVNDRYGHQGGDDVLRGISARLRECVRPLDAVGRYGGEEFIVVLPDCDNAQSAGERIRRVIAQNPIGSIAVTASIGVAMAVGYDSMESVVARADRALYQAKEEGRDRVVVAV